MSDTYVVRRIRSPWVYRTQRYAVEAVSMAFALLIAIWSVIPLYNMWVIALSKHGDIFSGSVWPTEPTLEAFRVVVTEDFWYLERFWLQFGNSFIVGLSVTFLTLFIGSLTSFTVGRMHLRNGWILSNAALMTYVIPASFLAIPIYRIMSIYGLSNHLASVILALTTFATPYAIFIFSQYGKSIPMELDESARIDGANPLQVYVRIYLLLSTPQSMTVAVTLAQFLNSDESPWNFMMATAIVYSIPPLILYYAFRSNMTAGLTMGGVKG